VIACVGAGQWGRNVIRNFYDLGVLSYVCDPESQARARITAYPSGVSVTESLEEILRDPQVQGVAIASPASTHGSIVRSALIEAWNEGRRRLAGVYDEAFAGTTSSRRERCQDQNTFTIFT